VEGSAASPRVGRGERAGHALAAGLLAAMFLASFLGADRWRVPGLPGVGGEGLTLCTFRRATGLPCPTCGLTRSFCALGRGAVGDAFAQFPLGPVLYAVLAAVMVRSGLIALTGRPRMERTARVLVRSIPVLAAAALVAWIVRLWLLFASGAAAEAWHASALGRLIELIT